MNYEFHVGDYVETVDGRIGYVDGIYTLTDSISWICIHAKSNDQLGAYSQTFTPQSKTEDHFLRIGAYDFTKRKKKKIEALTINKTMSQYTGDGTSNTRSDYTAVYENMKFQDKALDKINELVDAVNKLMDKEDN